MHSSCSSELKVSDQNKRIKNVFIKLRKYDHQNVHLVFTVLWSA